MARLDRRALSRHALALQGASGCRGAAGGAGGVSVDVSWHTAVSLSHVAAGGVEGSLLLALARSR